ncbi:MAG: hypothetical protein ACC662_04390, partial [Planctomycetota bacterium]
MHRTPPLLVALLVAFPMAFVVAPGVSGVSARADVLLLKDGRILERDGMKRVEGGVKVPFEHGDVVVPADRIQDAILENQPPPPPRNEAEKAKMAKGLVLFDGKWVKPEKRAKLLAGRIAERKAEVEVLRKHRLWRNRYKAETRHFRFEYTIPPFVYSYFRDVMEAYFKAFAKTWKVKQPKDLGKLTVCFYTDAEKFQQIGNVGPNILGYFRFVKPLELNFFYDRLDPRLTEQVMFHETNHYLQYLMNPKVSMPHFPGESLAEYYGASTYDPVKKKVETGLVLEGRLTEVKTDIAAGKMMSLKKMLTSPGMYEHYT